MSIKSRQERKRHGRRSSPVARDAQPSRRGVAIIWSLTVFLSAFLLFLVQPMICKAILPWFGGTPAVWTTSMFFFQVVLLIGYVYAHLSTRYLTPGWQATIHVSFAVIAIVLLPIYPSEGWQPTGLETHPTGQLLGLLTSSVGMQFLLLSTTAPLLQTWWHRSFGETPYKLYALSNGGSFLALVSYPFLIEPQIGVDSQMYLWSVMFFFVACALSYCGFFARRVTNSRTLETQTTPSELAPTWPLILAWLGLSMTGSVLLLSMTSHLTQNVAVVPFLWVAPLALYLLSFILCFADVSYYRRWLFGALMVVSQISASFLYNFDVVNNIILLLVIHLTALFSGCMVCHGELARLKPDARYLTNYFVVISVGGALGGLLVSVVAPHVFSNYYEYPLVLIACWVALICALLRDKNSFMYAGRPIWAWVGMTAGVFIFLLCLRNGIISELVSSFISRRSFYGVLAVRPFRSDDKANIIQLTNGTIIHGFQYLDDSRKDEPTSYYRRDSGLGFAMALVGEKPNKRVGMLGLGVGTIAAYSSTGDYFRAYEINTDVIELATDPNVFTFWSLLKQRGADSDIIVGDARISLASELAQGKPQDFDILVLDVFSGDAIPAHLLTIEAFKIYFQHLVQHGLLAVHISNRHLDLLPVVRSAAKQFPVQVALVSRPASEWVILGSPEAIALLAEQQPQNVKLLPPIAKLQQWTDDYSDIFSVLK